MVAGSANGNTCVYDSRHFSEGAVIIVPPQNRIYLQCRPQTIEFKGTQYTYLIWHMLGERFGESVAKESMPAKP